MLHVFVLLCMLYLDSGVLQVRQQENSLELLAPCEQQKMVGNKV